MILGLIVDGDGRPIPGLRPWAMTRGSPPICSSKASIFA